MGKMDMDRLADGESGQIGRVDKMADGLTPSITFLIFFIFPQKSKNPVRSFSRLYILTPSIPFRLMAQNARKGRFYGTLCNYSFLSPKSLRSAVNPVRRQFSWCLFVDNFIKKDVVFVMRNFDKKKYIESGVWHDNDYLVNPGDTAKRCACCDERFYTVEFSNCSAFVDNKLPVCSGCTHGSSNNYDRAREIVTALDISVECPTCGSFVHLVDCYKRIDGTNTISFKCESCRKKKK